MAQSNWAYFSVIVTMFRWPEEYLERAREEMAREAELRKMAQEQKNKNRALATMWHYC